MAQRNKKINNEVAGRGGGNGGWSKRKPVVEPVTRKPMKQNIGRSGAVKAPKE